MRASRLLLLLSSGAKAPVLTFINTASSASDLTTYDFGNFDVGSSPGLVIVAISGSGSGAGRTVSSISIGAASGTVHAQSTVSTFSTSAVASAIGSGTVNVTVTFSGAMSRATVTVWALRGYRSATPIDAKSAQSTSSTPSNAVTLSIPAKGVALFSHTHNNNSSSTWSSATAQLEQVIESVRFSSARLQATSAEAAHTETVSFTAVTQSSLSAASWR